MLPSHVVTPLHKMLAKYHVRLSIAWREKAVMLEASAKQKRAATPPFPLSPGKDPALVADYVEMNAHLVGKGYSPGATLLDFLRIDAW